MFCAAEQPPGAWARGGPVVEPCEDNRSTFLLAGVLDMLNLFKTTILNVRFRSRLVFCKDKLNIRRKQLSSLRGAKEGSSPRQALRPEPPHTSLAAGPACRLLTRVGSVPHLRVLRAQCDLHASVLPRVLQATGPPSHAALLHGRWFQHPPFAGQFPAPSLVSSLLFLWCPCDIASLNPGWPKPLSGR